MSGVSIITGDVTAEISDEEGNSAKISNDQLRVRDQDVLSALSAILSVLKSIDSRLARLESE